MVQASILRVPASSLVELIEVCPADCVLELDEVVIVPENE
jgi:hypothetical protein